MEIWGILSNFALRMTLLTAILARTPLISDPVPIFLSVMAIILVTPLLLNRLKIPHVIGLILAGVAVGPHGFGLLDKDMSFEVFGQVGLFYLRFLAGIERDMYHLMQDPGSLTQLRAHEAEAAVV